MIRGMIFHLMLLVVPFIIYSIYVYCVRRAGGEKTVEGRTVAKLFLAGLILMALSFFVAAGLRDDPSDGAYVPQRFEDGRLIDSEIVPEDKE